MNNQLNEYRQTLNGIDDEIKKLIIHRIETVKAVAEYKLENNMPIFQAGREEEILARITQSNDKNITSTLDVLYKTIMDASRLYQYSIINKGDFLDCRETAFHVHSPESIIGCQGITGAYSHQAARTIFKENTVLFFDTFADVFNAVESGIVEYAIVPLENSNAGVVKDNFDLLNKFDYYIVAEIALPISHCLLTNKNSNNIKIVYSHEQALNQCANYLSTHNYKRQTYSNTAAAAKYVAESNNAEYAAIASKFCAELYGLNVAEENIQDNELNTTRFIVVSKKLQIQDNAKKISIIVKLPHKTGNLHRLLMKFAFYKANLTRLESYPIANSNFEFMFFIDFEGNIYNKETCNLLQSIESEVEDFKFLGNY